MYGIYRVLTLNLTLSDPPLNREPDFHVDETFTQHSHINYACFAGSTAFMDKFKPSDIMK